MKSLVRGVRIWSSGAAPEGVCGWINFDDAPCGSGDIVDGELEILMRCASSAHEGHRGPEEEELYGGSSGSELRDEG